jgi:tryptophanyl-tRNA synthetase
VRTIATPFMAELRDAVGLRNLATKAASRRKEKSKAALPSFKQYRESDGKHYFKVVDAGGKLLAQSTAFASPQDAGRAIAQLKQGRVAGLEAMLLLADGLSAAELETILAALAEG